MRLIQKNFSKIHTFSLRKNWNEILVFGIGIGAHDFGIGGIGAHGTFYIKFQTLKKKDIKYIKNM